MLCVLNLDGSTFEWQLARIRYRMSPTVGWAGRISRPRPMEQQERCAPGWSAGFDSRHVRSAYGYVVRIRRMEAGQFPQQKIARIADLSKEVLYPEG